MERDEARYGEEGKAERIGKMMLVDVWQQYVKAIKKIKQSKREGKMRG